MLVVDFLKGLQEINR